MGCEECVFMLVKRVSADAVKLHELTLVKLWMYYQ